MNKKSLDSFSTLSTLAVGKKKYQFYSLKALPKAGFDLSRLPFSLRVFLENLLRHEDGSVVKKADIAAVAQAAGKKPDEREVFFMPARVLMQDFTGVPAIVDLAAMRDAIKRMGGDPKKINPAQPVDLVVDHSVQVDSYGTADSFKENSKLEFSRNKERYSFLKWGQKAFVNFHAVPPETGICHQVNLEYLAKVVWSSKEDGQALAYPDTVVGTDSHTTMINGLGVLGWGVGGIEAEAAMLGQAMPLLIPEVVGFKLSGKLKEGATATDAVLTVTEMLRKKGVVGKFVEFYGPGVGALAVADRATISNMCPEYGATVGYFPVDDRTLEYLELTGRPKEEIALVEAYCKEQGLFRTDKDEPIFNDTLELDLGKVAPSLAGPKRPQDRIELSKVKASWEASLPGFLKEKDKKGNLPAPAGTEVPVKLGKESFKVGHGSVVIAAITSCTNTSNPSVMLGAGLLAQKALAKGLMVKPWVKTSLAPGSKTVMDYLTLAGLTEPLAQLKFNLVGYGCTTCIGNSGPLPEPIAAAVSDKNLIVSAVLSGNRNFEGRINPLVKAAYLTSPPLVVAYALAGRMDLDLAKEPLGTGKDGKPVYLKDIWPTSEEVAKTVGACVKRDMFLRQYGDVFAGDQDWKSLDVALSELYAWDPQSTYVRLPPYFEGMTLTPQPLSDVKAARVLAVFGDSVTTDHISPAGNIAKDGPAGLYLQSKGVKPADFNSYGARRGNHEVMVRGTFANIRIKNLMLDVAGGNTLHMPDKKQMSIFEASEKYIAEKVPLVVLAGKEYGSGSSRDWAAKGPALLGVKAVIAQSYERIHRSNLVGMGVLPLQFLTGQSAQSLGLTGLETFEISGVAKDFRPRKELSVKATADGKVVEFKAIARIDTPIELEYYRYGGVLRYVLCRMLAQSGKGAPVAA